MRRCGTLWRLGARYVSKCPSSSFADTKLEARYVDRNASITRHESSKCAALLSLYIVLQVARGFFLTGSSRQGFFLPVRRFSQIDVVKHGSDGITILLLLTVRALPSCWTQRISVACAVVFSICHSVTTYRLEQLLGGELSVSHSIGLDYFDEGYILFVSTTILWVVAVWGRLPSLHFCFICILCPTIWLSQCTSLGTPLSAIELTTTACFFYASCSLAALSAYSCDSARRSEFLRDEAIYDRSVLHSLLHDMCVPSLVVDSSQRVVFANSALEQQFGLVSGLPLEEVPLISSGILRCTKPSTSVMSGMNGTALADDPAEANLISALRQVITGNSMEAHKMLAVYDERLVQITVLPRYFSDGWEAILMITVDVFTEVTDARREAMDNFEVEANSPPVSSLSFTDFMGLGSDKDVGHSTNPNPSTTTGRTIGPSQPPALNPSNSYDSLSNSTGGRRQNRAEHKDRRSNNSNKRHDEGIRPGWKTPDSGRGTVKSFDSGMVFEHIRIDTQKGIEGIEKIAMREHWLIDKDDITVHWKESVLGRGGFGSVYAGSFLGTPVAVKIPTNPDGLRFSRRELVSIGNELRVLRQVRHENIVLFYGAFMEPSGGLIAVVLELVKGQCLDVFLREREKAHDSQRFLLILGTCRALRYLHAHEPCIVHGDLKPSNIMITMIGPPGGRVIPRIKLLDFGLSRALTRDVRPLSGTREWQAPEILLNPEIKPSPAADTYSFGRLVHFITISAVANTTTLMLAQNAGPQVTSQTLIWPRSTLVWPDTSLAMACRETADLCMQVDPNSRPSMGAAHEQIFMLDARVRDLGTGAYEEVVMSCGDDTTNHQDESGSTSREPDTSVMTMTVRTPSTRQQTDASRIIL